MPLQTYKPFQTQTFKQSEPERMTDYPLGDTFMDVMVGKTIETGADVATFGLYKPDVIPEDAEHEHPYATTIGNVAGGLLGMLPSFGISGIAANAFLKGLTVLNWGARVSKVAQSYRAAGVLNTAGNIFRMGGIDKAMVTFAIHDAAREIVRQTQERDPSMYKLAEESARGGLMGMMLGSTGFAYNISKPAKQAIAMGTTMYLASAINDAYDGVDVFSADYQKSAGALAFGQGVIFGLIGSRGWKERRAAVVEQNTRGILDELKYWNESGILPKAEIEEINRSVYGELKKGTNFEKIIDNLNSIYMKGGKTPGSVESARKRLHGVFRELDMESNASYRELLNTFTGKDHISALTLDEVNKAFRGISDWIYTSKQGYDPSTIKPIGWLQQLWQAPEKIIVVNNMKLLLEDPFAAAKLANHAKGLMANWTVTQRMEWEKGWNEELKGKFKVDRPTDAPEPVIGKISDALLDLEARVRGTGRYTMKPTQNRFISESEMIEPVTNISAVADLSPKLRQIYEQYKFIQDSVYQRQNAVNIATGYEPVKWNEFYMRASVDQNAMKRAGRRADIPKPGGLRENEIAVGLVSTEKPLSGGLIYKHDPFTVLEDMFNIDMVSIYIREPMNLLKQRLNNLQKAGIIDAQQRAGAEWFGSHFIERRPFDSTIKQNATVRSWLESKPGLVIDNMLAKLDSGLSGTTSPASYFASTVSGFMTKSYIFGRYKMALRNAFQGFFELGKSSLASNAKALLYPVPEEMERMVKGAEPVYKEFSMDYNRAITTADESMHRAVMGGELSQAANIFYTKSQNFTVNHTLKTSIHEMFTRVNDPKWRKYGWADEEGIRLRKETGNPHILSYKEKYFLAKEAGWNVEQTSLCTTSGVCRQFRKLRSAKSSGSLHRFPRTTLPGISPTLYGV
jgi:hypothetical protein